MLGLRTDAFNWRSKPSTGAILRELGLADPQILNLLGRSLASSREPLR